ncbi:MAG: hypothetical protein JSU70_13590 [Phycisphaerales bacterium]|nr:MAG: hypothetical protein JSU70_13590 [Phycisphaerales bacterium]
MRKQIAGPAVLAACLLFTTYAAAEERCCATTVAMPQVPMPPGQEIDHGGWFVDTFLSAFMRADLTDCPRPVDIMNYEGIIDLNRLIGRMLKAAAAQADAKAQGITAQFHGFNVDYLFMGTLAVANGEVIEGELRGQWTFKVELTDNCPDPGRNGRVVNAAETSWNGLYEDGGSQIRAAAGSFMPLDDLIDDYERIPEDCEIRLEKEPVKVGEKVIIYLENIVDANDRPSRPWQQLLVKAEEGEITNGTENGDYKRFAVNDGAIAIEYKAPVECPVEKKDTLIVKNSCECCLATRINVIPDHEIARKEIEIECAALLEINEYTVCHVDHQGIRGTDEVWHTAKVPFFIEGTEIQARDPGEFEWRLSGHWSGGPCSGSDTGSGSGQVNISGNLVAQGDGVPQLHITFEIVKPLGSLKTVMYRRCADYRYYTVVYGPDRTYHHEPRELEMPYQDGHEIVIEGSGADPPAECSWINTYILHIHE